MAIEHACWRGPAYEKGIGGQRIAICGYSHYSNDPDHDSLTKDILQDVVDGVARYAFFTSIAHAFATDDLAAFWNSVVFFNFVPAIVGRGEDKFAIASEIENERARDRVVRILEQHRPNKLLVFSSKAWAALPQTDEERAGNADASRGTYTLGGGHQVRAFGLRHPQGAPSEVLRVGVKAALGLN